MIEIFSDGATVGHNGKLGTVKEIGIGFCCPHYKYGYAAKLKGISNNEAEFQAIIAAMEWALEMNIEEVRFKADSQIIINRAKGKRPKGKFRNERMDTFQDRVLELARKFKKIDFMWIPREQNIHADYYSKKACSMPLSSRW